MGQIEMERCIYKEGEFVLHMNFDSSRKASFQRAETATKRAEEP